MIRNLYDLPIGLRYDVFSSDWLTAAELNEFALRTEDALVEMKLSKAELARRAGVSEATVFSLLGGRHIGRKSMLAISKVLPSSEREPIENKLFEKGKDHKLIDAAGQHWKLTRTPRKRTRRDKDADT